MDETYETRPGRRFPRFILVCFAGSVLVVLFLISHVRSHFRSLEVERWPKVTGRIQEGVVNKPGGRSDPRAGQLSIRYVYEVGGKAYSGSRLSPNGNELDALQSANVLGFWKIGSAVEVHYNPNNPDDSYLESGLNKNRLDGGVYFLGIVAIILASYGTLGIVLHRRYWKPRKQRDLYKPMNGRSADHPDFPIE